MYKLTIECKDLSELSKVVGRLGDSATSGVVSASAPAAPTTSTESTSSRNVTKAELIDEAKSLGLDVNTRDTKVEIERKIEEAKTGRPPEPVQPAEVPSQAVPHMTVEAPAPAPQAPVAPATAPQAPVAQAPQRAYQQPAQQAYQQAPAAPAPAYRPPHELPVQQTAPSGMTKEGALEAISGRLRTLKEAGVPEDQLMPVVQQACQAVGAPINVRLSEMQEHHLLAAYQGILAGLDHKLAQSQMAPGQFA